MQSVIDFVRATTRPGVTYALVGGVVYLAVRQFTIPAELLTLAATSVGFWFADRKTRPEA